MSVVNCWFMGEQELPQMWEAYASVSEGVAIRSSCERLSISLAVHQEVSRVQKVRYVDFATEDMGLYKGESGYREGIPEENGVRRRARASNPA